jgi:hypothetical protein
MSVVSIGREPTASRILDMVATRYEAAGNRAGDAFVVFLTPDGIEKEMYFPEDESFTLECIKERLSQGHRATHTSFLPYLEEELAPIHSEPSADDLYVEWTLHSQVTLESTEIPLLVDDSSVASPPAG